MVCCSLDFSWEEEECRILQQFRKWVKGLFWSGRLLLASPLTALNAQRRFDTVFGKKVVVVLETRVAYIFFKLLSAAFIQNKMKELFRYFNVKFSNVSQRLEKKILTLEWGQISKVVTELYQENFCQLWWWENSQALIWRTLFIFLYSIFGNCKLILKLHPSSWEERCWKLS